MRGRRQHVRFYKKCITEITIGLCTYSDTHGGLGELTAKADDARSDSGLGAIVCVGEDAVPSSDAAVALSAGEVLAAEASARPALEVAAHRVHVAVDAQKANSSAVWACPCAVQGAGAKDKTMLDR